MAELTPETRATIIQIYIQENFSVTNARRRIANELQVALSNTQIKRMYDQFLHKNCFSVGHLKRRRGIAARPATVNNNLSQHRVMVSVLGSPRKSIRRRSLELGITSRTLKRILKDLRMKPYKIRQVQELKPADYGERVYYCNWLIDKLNEDPMLLFKLLFSDEAKFFLNGVVSSSHAYYWATQNPNERKQRSMDKNGVMVFCAFTASEILGPYFFDLNVNQQSYIELLREKLIPDLQRLNMTEEVWFMQDGAPAHRANATMNLLRGVFDERLISLGADVEWPPRSPDLTPCDYFLWGFLKQLVYKKRFDNIEDLKREITRCIEYISPDMLERTFTHSLIERTNMCLAANGGHFE